MTTTTLLPVGALMMGPDYASDSPGALRAQPDDEAISLPPPSEDEPRLRIGTLLAGRYCVERVIASGGMGVVYACFDTMLDRPVAIKLVRQTLIHNEQLMGRFFREARIAAQLRSRHVAQVFDCGTLPTGGPYMVMELLEGCDLFHVLRKCGPLPPAVLVNYARQVCEGLREAHRKSIVHRDLKPENLFLTFGPDGSEIIKIVDFGISKQGNLREHGRALTNPTESVGSPHYMSPEQLTSPGLVDTRADIWALGIVMYELLTGSVPFDGIGVAQVCVSVLSEPIQPISEQRPDVSPALEAVIMRCLERDPNGRFSSAEELSQALSAFIQGSDVASMSLRRTDLDLGFPTPDMRTPPSAVTTAAIELLPLQRKRAQRRWAAFAATLSSSAVFALAVVGAEGASARASGLASFVIGRVNVALQATPVVAETKQQSAEPIVAESSSLASPSVTPVPSGVDQVGLTNTQAAAPHKLSARNVRGERPVMALGADQAADADVTASEPGGTSRFSAAIRSSLPATPGPSVQDSTAAAKLRRSRGDNSELMNPY